MIVTAKPIDGSRGTEPRVRDWSLNATALDWARQQSRTRGFSFGVTMKPPAFQFYAADFLVGTADMEAAEVGAYIRLLCHQWDRGFVTKEKAARLAGTKITPAVLAKFSETNGELRNERLEFERAKQAEYRAERSRSGKVGAQSRWKGSANGSAMAQPPNSQSQNDGLSSSFSFSFSTENPESGSGAFSKPKDTEGEMPSVFKDLTEDDLRDPSRLAAWLRKASQRPNPIVTWSQVNLLNVIATACHALRQNKIKGQPVRSRVAFFCSLMVKANETGKWDISAADEDAARKLLARLSSAERAQ